MKRVPFLVLAVVLMAVVLAPVAIARAASWKWNADKTQRILPDGRYTSRPKDPVFAGRHLP